MAAARVLLQSEDHLTPLTVSPGLCLQTDDWCLGFHARVCVALFAGKPILSPS